MYPKLFKITIQNKEEIYTIEKTCNNLYQALDKIKNSLGCHINILNTQEIYNPMDKGYKLKVNDNNRLIDLLDDREDYIKHNSFKLIWV